MQYIGIFGAPCPGASRLAGVKKVEGVIFFENVNDLFLLLAVVGGCWLLVVGCWLLAVVVVVVVVVVVGCCCFNDQQAWCFFFRF